MKNMEVRNNSAGRYCYCIFRTKIQSGKRASWEQQHMEDINAAFGKDMSGYVLAIYDTLEEIEDDFEDYAHDTDCCRKVLDKWVFVMA